jgi:hypothetical protein
MTEQAATPTTPDAAQGRLAELSSNPDWGAKVVGQDPAAFAEFQTLTKTVAGGTAAVAEATSKANDAKMTADFLAGPLPAGFPDLGTPVGAELAQILKGEKTISPELHRAVKNKLDSMIASADWRARFDAKDETALRDWHLATVLLTAPVAEKAA